MRGLHEGHEVPNATSSEAGMRDRVLSYDWSASPLGPMTAWPQSLKTAVDIMLSSRYAMWLLWGSELTFFYNDAYRPTLGLKRSWALGSRSDEVWREIWPDIGPRIERVLNGGGATWDEGLLLFLERSGFSEETYHTFSYSPLSDDAGAVVGMLCVVTEETDRVIGERRLRLLHDLGRRLADTRTPTEVWAAAQASLETSSRDVPWMLGYVLDHADQRAMLASASGVDHRGVEAPPWIDLRAPSPWPLRELLSQQGETLVHDLPRVPESERARTTRPPCQALLVPVATQDRGRPIGVVILGLNPHRPLDASFREFIDLFVGQLSASLVATEAYESERRRAELLAEVDRAKTTFFSNVSHEFRTPLTLMLGPLEDLLARGATDEDRRLVDIAHRNGLRLLRLVNNLLDFARVEAGRTRASFRPTDLAALTADLTSSFRAATDRAGLRLHVDCPPAAEPVFVDWEMWEKIVLNLVSNAFKFTLDGAITVQLRQADGFARLRIIDTGTGIAADQLPTLFDRFKRVDGARGRSFEGSGIGLALVKELVALHGGAVAVESEVDRGSVFTVSLPLGRNHLPQDLISMEEVAPGTPRGSSTFVAEAMRWLPDGGPGTGNAVAPAVLGEGSRVLVADDNADLRDYIAGLLRSRGYLVDTAADGVEALEAVRTDPPDLLVSDVMMPRLDGFGLLSAVRDDPGLRELPVLMLSARAGDEAAVQGLDAGADDYLTKPFSGRELVARVASNIRLAKIRRDAALQVIESEGRFQNMADHAPVILWMTDATGSCTYLNRTWYDFTGADPAKDGFDWRDRIHAEDIGRTEDAFREAALRRQAIQLEFRLRCADGSYRWVISAATLRTHPDGAFLGYIGSTIDVTDLKEAETVLARRVEEEVAARIEAEDALRQAQKLEAVGQLTGGVAHDFNNLLTIIRSSVDLLKRPSLTETRRERYVDAISTTVDRASKLTSQLLAFARRQALRPEVFDVGSAVRSVVEMVGTLVGSKIDVVVRLPDQPCRIHADVGQFETALVNMAVNARDAMDGAGTLTVSVTKVATSGDVDHRHGLVAITLTDTGTGIPPDEIERIFEPFYTTKGVGKGTGLGLSQVFGFAKQSGGEVRVQSEVGTGTSFTLCLPRADADTVPEPRAEPDEELDDVVVRGIRILLVEDNADVGESSSQSLEEIGFRTRLVSSAREALAELSADAAAFDVVFTDVMMPGMNGADLGREIRRLHPGIPIVLTSGYNSVLAQDGSHGFELLQKPYSVDDVSRVLLRAVQKGRRGVAASAGLRGN